TRRGGSAIIACRAAAGDRLRISVIDTGAGISEENLARLFRPFERLGAENSAIEGTGLGLSLCKQLIESMHGSIEAESMLGRGSSFSVTLPVAAEPVTESVAALKGGTRAPLKTILYIEDNLSCVEIIEQLLSRRPDVKLLAAAQGALGIDLARAHRPDLILLDLRLPDINGEEVLQELRRDARTSALPVVLISGEASPEQIERLLKAGASEYVAKPLDIPRFFTVLDQILQPSPARVRISDVWPDSA
ncbi:MAG: response regulator, partial [Chthoniobacterales bacterium]